MFTKHDAENLDFLRNASEQVLMDWYDQASDDDIAYAQELLEQWSMELLAQEFTAMGFEIVDIPTTMLQ